MAREDDIWYAVSVTKVLLPPRQTLQTFGSTSIRYHLVSELMDEVSRVRVRTGKLYSERPLIMTPLQLADQLLDGFGDKAKEYADWLVQQGDMTRILKYGLRFRKDQMQEETLSDSMEAVANRVRESVEAEGDPLTAVICGADELWEVSLLRFVVEYIQRSIPTNMQEMAQRTQEERRERNLGVHREIELAFQAAESDATRINDLGLKLQRYGLFEQYEDRFYSLLKE